MCTIGKIDSHQQQRISACTAVAQSAARLEPSRCTPIDRCIEITAPINLQTIEPELKSHCQYTAQVYGYGEEK